MLVDDHAIVRMGLASILGTNKDLEIVGEADDGESAIRKAHQLKPDVILMDMMLSEMDGADATAKIHQQNRQCKILILTSYGTADGIAHALDAGASGALLKTVDYSDLVATIRAIADGQQVIAPEISRQLKKNPPLPGLTNRQREILSLVSQGYMDADIAKKTNISPNSIRNHMTLIFNKLGAANRAEAVAIALRKHLLKS